MPPVGFEPTISASEWPLTYDLDRAVSGTGFTQSGPTNYKFLCGPAANSELILMNPLSKLVQQARQLPSLTQVLGKLHRSLQEN